MEMRMVDEFVPRTHYDILKELEREKERLERILQTTREEDKLKIEGKIKEIKRKLKKEKGVKKRILKVITENVPVMYDTIKNEDTQKLSKMNEVRENVYKIEGGNGKVKIKIKSYTVGQYGVVVTGVKKKYGEKEHPGVKKTR